MSSASEIFMKYICPSAGGVLANVMFCAPIHSLRRALQNGNIGDLNPKPWAFQIGNCIGWTAYSFLTNDIFLFIADGPGILISFWLNYGAIKLEYNHRYSLITTDYQSKSTSSDVEKLQIVMIHHNDDDGDSGIVNGVNDTHDSSVQNHSHCVDVIHDSNSLDDLGPKKEQICCDINITGAAISDISSSRHSKDDKNNNDSLLFLTPHEKLCLSISAFWLILLSCCKFVPLLITQQYDKDITSKVQFTIGLITNINSIFFYGAPLSTIVTVIREKNSSSIHRMTLLTYLLSSSFWTIYGIAILDMMIAVPSMIALFLSLIQLILCLVFRKLSEDLEGKKVTRGTLIIREESTTTF